MTVTVEGEKYTPTSRDRAHLFPSHEGLNVLPNNPFFTKLLRHAHRRRVAIRDRNHDDVSKTYAEVLVDSLVLRETLKPKLSVEVLKKLRQGDEVFIGVLSAGGYEFAVAMLAVLAIGAAVVPSSFYLASELRKPMLIVLDLISE